MSKGFLQVRFIELEMSEKSDNLEYLAIETHLNEAMYKATQAGKHDLKPNGVCHNCKEPVEHPQLFCDSDCAEDYQKRQFSRSQRLY